MALEEDDRIREIQEIAKNQLNRKIDLPPDKRMLIGGGRATIKEIPMNPRMMDSIFSSPHSFLPEAERIYVKGREFSIESK